MTKARAWCAVFATVMGLVAAAGFGQVPERVSLIRDTGLEQTLRAYASADQTITPAKVLSWLKSLASHTTLIAAPSSTEFQPILNVDNHHLRVIAAIAYKF